MDLQLTRLWLMNDVTHDGIGSEHEQNEVSAGVARAFLAHQLGAMVADLRSESLQAWLAEVRPRGGAVAVVAEAVVDSVTRTLCAPDVSSVDQEFSLDRLDRQISTLRRATSSADAARRAVGELAEEFTRALLNPTFAFETATGRRRNDDAMRAFQAAVADAASAALTEEKGATSPSPRCGAIFEVFRETAASVRICLEGGAQTWRERVRVAQPAGSSTTAGPLTSQYAEETEFDFAFAAGHGAVFAAGIKPVV
ncbi:MAG: hypothetical protein J0M17_24530 [Planctomycetes bacterium]|nr:hypothetical protein [Planctomycetota bacterium]